MKKFLSAVLAAALVISCISMISVFAADATRYNENLLTEAQSAFTGQTAAPAGWEKFLCGELQVVKDPVDASNDVLYATVEKSWASPAISVGNLVKSEMDKSGVTKAVLYVSAKVYVESADTAFAANDNVIAQPTLRGTAQYLFSRKTVGAESDQWVVVEGYYDVDLSTFDTTVKFCFDSLGNNAAPYGIKGIYIDDVIIALAGIPRITVDKAEGISYIAATSSAGFITAEDVTGTNAKARVMISNESEQDFYAALVPSILHPQTAGGNTWISMVKDEYLLVPAGKSVWLERTVPAEYTVAASAGKWESKDYTYGSYFMRLNVSADAEGKTVLPQGTVFVLSGNEKIESGCMNTSNGYYTVNAVTNLPESTKDPYVPEIKAAEVVNGNAEDGTKGWGVFFGGNVEQVAGGADGTAHAIKFTPGENQYHSVAFDFGPAIIQDSENGYEGAGAGEYTISFWAKADSVAAGQSTKFKVVLNSQVHKDAKDGVIAGIEGSGYVNSYITTSTIITLTDQWQKFEAKVTISEAYLKTIQALYDAGNTKAYQLVLRLDGAGESMAFGKAENITVFPYYVDEAAITAAAGTSQPGGEEQEPAKTEGVTVKMTKVDEGAEVYVRFSNFEGHLKNGKMTLTVYNTSGRELNVQLQARLGDGKWTTVKNGEETAIPAGKAVTLTIECPDKMTSPVDSKEYVPFALLKLLDFKAGDTFSVYGFTAESMDAQKPILTVTTAGKGLEASADFGTTTTPCPMGDAAPVAMIAAAAAAFVMLGLTVAVKKRKATI